MTAIKRPEHTFRIVVSPVYYVTSCPMKLAEEAKGLMGFHGYERCPNCIKHFAGWEFWGENGHMQGAAPTRDRLVHWLKLKAREQSRVSGVGYYQPKGSRLGYRFVKGSTIFYRGN